MWKNKPRFIAKKRFLQNKWRIFDSKYLEYVTYTAGNSTHDWEGSKEEAERFTTRLNLTVRELEAKYGRR
jgi:hypothetical protein